MLAPRGTGVRHGRRPALTCSAPSNTTCRHTATIFGGRAGEAADSRDRRHVDGPGAAGYRARMVVEQPVFNPFDPEFAANPYAGAGALPRARPGAPDARSARGCSSRYDDVLRVLRDPTLSVEDRQRRRSRRRCREPRTRGARRRAQRRQPGDAQPRPTRPPPAAPARREGVHAARRRRPAAARAALFDDLVARRASRASADALDVIADVAFPLPFSVISDMLGMPEGQDRLQLRDVVGRPREDARPDRHRRGVRRRARSRRRDDRVPARRVRRGSARTPPTIC